MLDFSDKPYRFFPPKPSWLVSALAMRWNRRFVLPGRNHRVKEIQLRNAERVLPVIKSGARLILLPNHSTHSDPQLMLDVQRRMNVTSSMMAAYDVFLRGKLNAWIMQRMGCFSIDREGSDSQAMKCAVDLLVEGKRALTIFPEGNVLLMNDRVAPFLGGAAFIAMRAQKKLGEDKSIYAVPISMKFSHLTDCRDKMLSELGKLEASLSIQPDAGMTIRERLKAIGLQILDRNLTQRGHLPPHDKDANLGELLTASAVQILDGLQSKIGMDPGGGTPLERVRKIRSEIHQIRIDESRKLDHRVATGWADEAILAMRILSYSGDYLSDSPTLDRHCETLEKLREDLAEKIIPPIGDRRAVVQFGEPMNLAEQLGKKSRVALGEITSGMEQSVQAGLDELNAANDLPGAALLE